MEDGQTDIHDNIDNQNIPSLDITNAETPHLQIRKKELVKNRKFNKDKKIINKIICVFF